MPMSQRRSIQSCQNAIGGRVLRAGMLAVVVASCASGSTAPGARPRSYRGVATPEEIPGNYYTRLVADAPLPMMVVEGG
jgi:hypothetical protein